ncbi:hypothetical protein BDZ89DRAFT_1167902 [Hymenopellis radicata]|nr:hypothetical protein BDZ89DRAFT_1167902 [Hymenopellis radicata]
MPPIVFMEGRHVRNTSSSPEPDETQLELEMKTSGELTGFIEDSDQSELDKIRKLVLTLEDVDEDDVVTIQAFLTSLPALSELELDIVPIWGYLSRVSLPASMPFQNLTKLVLTTLGIYSRGASKKKRGPTLPIRPYPLGLWELYQASFPFAEHPFPLEELTFRVVMIPNSPRGQFIPEDNINEWEVMADVLVKCNTPRLNRLIFAVAEVEEDRDRRVDHPRRAVAYLESLATYGRFLELALKVPTLFQVYGSYR